MVEKIKRLISYYMRIYHTNDPYILADYLNVIILYVPLEDISGYYKYLKRRKYIIVNSEIQDDNFRRMVVAHELGHAILHTRANCAFMQKHTLLLTSKIEREANLFAAHLLIDDNTLKEYEGYTQEHFCLCTGYPKELIELRLK